MTGETSYRANAFAPETGTKVHIGSLRILADRVGFEGGTFRGELPLAGMRLRRGGHNDQQLFFEHPDHPGWSIYSSDQALFRDPVLSANPLFSGILKSVARAHRSPAAPVIILVGIVVAVVGALVVLWLSKDRIAEYIADKIPISWEEQLGEQIFRQVSSQGRIVTDSPWREPVQRITDRLLPAVRDSGYNFKFHIMQDTNVNAFAIPGGHVVILTGLLERADSSEEVAGVLAHELAHVTRRHSLRNMVKSAGLVIMIQAVLGDASGLLALVAEGSRYLLQQKFSRDFEREADDTGWSYLIEAKIDPRGMIRFFEKLKEMAVQAGMSSMESSLALLNTHPASQERIERLSAKWEASPIKSGFAPLPSIKKE